MSSVLDSFKIYIRKISFGDDYDLALFTCSIFNKGSGLYDLVFEKLHLGIKHILTFGSKMCLKSVISCLHGNDITCSDTFCEFIL